MVFDQKPTPINHPIKGEWFIGQTNQSRTAYLVRQGRSLEIRDETGKILSCGQLPTITISQRIGNIERKLSFADGTCFSSKDNDGIDKILKEIGHKSSSLIAKFETFRPRLFIFMLVAIGLFYGIYRTALPIIVSLAIWMTPSQVVDLMGQSSLQTIDKTILNQTKLDQDKQNKIKMRFDTLAAASPRGKNGFKLYFRDAPAYIGPNAFALPDGSIIVTDQLIKLADNDDDMILGVLAHEIGHVEQQHSLRQIYRATGTAGLIMLITGDVGEVLEHILLEGNVILSLSYSRAAEAEADLYGVNLMHKTGMDPSALLRFFTLIKQQANHKSSEETASVFDSHPSDDARITAIKTEIEKLKENP